MASNTIKINVGSLGSLGGEGNLRDVSIHDSTCSCEGCLEKRVADREFSITTDNVFGEKDFGFNKGDADGFDESSDECSSSSSSDDDEGSIADIFDITDDPPNDDGYCNDGRDSEDTYSVCSPKPCTIDTNTADPELGNNGDDDIELEDTPPLKDFDDIINLASIEAAKTDGQSIKDCADAINDSEHPTIQMKDLHTFMDQQRYSAAQYWKKQVHIYETKITTLFKTVSSHEDVIKAAKRRMDYDEHEINRLRELCMEKTAEINKKDRQIYNMASDMGRQALRHNDINEHQQNTIADLKQKLFAQRRRTAQLEEELQFTRKRLLTHTRRSIPHRSKRARRRIMEDDGNESTITAGSSSDTEIETEESSNVALVNAMIDLETLE